MKLLKIENNAGKYSIDGSSYQNIDEIGKEDIMGIMNMIMTTDTVEFDVLDVNNKIGSPAQNIIYTKLSEKFNEIKEQKTTIIDKANLKYKDAFIKYSN